MIVVDASCVVAALIDNGPTGRWAVDVMRGERLLGPHLLPVEVANVLRTAERRGDITSDSAAMAFQDLGEMRIELCPFEPVRNRVWELRGTLRPYDAWYIALAEVADAPLATLDHRLTRAPGPTCRFVTPPE